MSNERTTSKHVLVVEDEPDFAALVASVLRTNGYDVTVASNAEEALQEVHERVPDLITLDLQMPGRSGLHFYRKMKSSDIYRDIPVVVITGVTRDDQDVKNLVRSFFEVDHLPSPESYIEKPFDNQHLIDVVEHVFAQSK